MHGNGTLESLAMYSNRGSSIIPGENGSIDTMIQFQWVQRSFCKKAKKRTKVPRSLLTSRGNTCGVTGVGQAHADLLAIFLLLICGPEGLHLGLFI